MKNLFLVLIMTLLVFCMQNCQIEDKNRPWWDIDQVIVNKSNHLVEVKTYSPENKVLANFELKKDESKIYQVKASTGYPPTFDIGVSQDSAVIIFDKEYYLSFDCMCNTPRNILMVSEPQYTKTGNGRYVKFEYVITEEDYKNAKKIGG